MPQSKREREKGKEKGKEKEDEWFRFPSLHFTLAHHDGMVFFFASPFTPFPWHRTLADHDGGVAQDATCRAEATQEHDTGFAKISQANGRRRHRRQNLLGGKPKKINIRETEEEEEEAEEEEEEEERRKTRTKRRTKKI